MGEYADELPRKFISFRSLENEPTEEDGNNNEAVDNFPNVSHDSESETATAAEIETTPTKSLAVLHAAAVGESAANDDVDIVAEGVCVASGESLLSGSDGGSGALERFLHDHFDSLSGEVLERIVEADLSGALASLEENGRNRHTGGHETVLSDEILLSGDVDRVPRSDFQQRSSFDTKRPVSIDVEGERLRGPPSKSVCLILRMGEINVNRRVVIFLGCQLLGSLFLVLPNMVRQITAPLDWSLMHERKLMSQLGRKFVLVVQKDFPFILELKPSLVLVLVERSVTRATLPGRC